MPVALTSPEQRLDPVSPYVVAAGAPHHTLQALDTDVLRLVTQLGLA